MEKYYDIRKYAIDTKTKVVSKDYTVERKKFESKAAADAYCEAITKVDALYIAKEIEVEIIKTQPAEVKEEPTLSL